MTQESDETANFYRKIQFQPMKIDTSSHSLPLVITTELTEAEHRFEILKSENLL